MSKEVAKKETTELAIPEDVAASNWGAIEAIETKDVDVPKIYHQQAMSVFVSEGKARPGDFSDSLTGETLCKKEDKLEVIIFGMYKTMVIKKFDVMSNIWKLDKIITIQPDNALEHASKPLVEEINGDKFSNNLYYNYYCLLPGKIKESPYVLSMGSTKTKAAKKINTMLAKLNQMHKPGASIIFQLQSVAEKNDRGSWFGVEVTQGRNTTAEELTLAHAWYIKSKSQKFVAAEESDTEDLGEHNI